MKHRVVLWLCVMACAGSVGADVIMFNDGAFDEGYVHFTGTFVTVRGRDGKSEYSVPTAIVARIVYDRWYHELEENDKDGTKGGVITLLSTQNIVVATTSDAVYQQMDKQKRAFAWLRAMLQKDGPRYTTRGTAQAVRTLVIFGGFVISVLISTIATIFLIIDAFKRSVLWGLLCLFCSIGLLIYLFTEYEGRRGRMLFYMMAPLVWLLLAMGFQQCMRLVT